MPARIRRPVFRSVPISGARIGSTPMSTTGASAAAAATSAADQARRQDIDGHPATAQEVNSGGQELAQIGHDHPLFDAARHAILHPLLP